MTRIPPSFSPPEVEEKKKPDYVSQTRRYKVITPLFGGGVTPGEADPVTTVRGTEVRGHLRFWWRAIRGFVHGEDLGKMKQREEKIWGSAGAKRKPVPSPVKIAVFVRNSGKPFQATRYNGNRINNIGDPGSQDSYVAFPLREKSNPKVIEGIEFDLEITLPNDENIKKEVEAALWAWETFGGIGARTRRGFGSLHCTHIDTKPISVPRTRDVRDQINQNLAEYIDENLNWPAGMPHMTQSLKFRVIERHNLTDVIDAWRYLVGKLKNFRQTRHGRFGRSKWPEPDQIRRETSDHVPGHAPVHTVHKFPRGKFGLPIIFEFKDADAGDPQKTTLQGVKVSNDNWHDRMASPLIIRPIACSDGAVGLAAILEWEPLNPNDESYTPPGGLILKGAPGDPQVYSDLDQTEAQKIEPLNGEPDVLQAFLNEL